MNPIRKHPYSGRQGYGLITATLGLFVVLTAMTGCKPDKGPYSDAQEKQMRDLVAANQDPSKLPPDQAKQREQMANQMRQSLPHIVPPAPPR